MTIPRAALTWQLLRVLSAEGEVDAEPVPVAALSTDGSLFLWFNAAREPDGRPHARPGWPPQSVLAGGTLRLTDAAEVTVAAAQSADFGVGPFAGLIAFVVPGATGLDLTGALRVSVEGADLALLVALGPLPPANPR